MDNQLKLLREAMIDLLWDQWSALGVAGRASGNAVPFVVDPEALLLATIRFGANDSRLVTEVTEWLSRYGGMISLQRLKNLQKAWRGWDALWKVLDFETGSRWRVGPRRCHLALVRPAYSKTGSIER